MSEFRFCSISLEQMDQNLTKLYKCIYIDKIKVNRIFTGHFSQRGSFMVWEINMGVCPRLEFDNIMFINCLEYDFYIYGAFEFLCNSIANL